MVNRQLVFITEVSHVVTVVLRTRVTNNNFSSPIILDEPSVDVPAHRAVLGCGFGACSRCCGSGRCSGADGRFGGSGCQGGSGGPR